MANFSAEEVFTLDVITPDEFDHTDFDQEEQHRIQTNFYKGAPPQWVNFYLAEKNGMPLVKREGYNKIRHLIETGQRRKTVTMVTLLHQPGSGGSSLAMQVLWDLRTRLWCTKLVIDIGIDPKIIARDLVIRVTMQNLQKPVLLLLDNVDTLKDNFSKTLQKRLIDELSKIMKRVSIIILNCVRKIEFPESNSNNTVLLSRKLNIEREAWEREEFDQHHIRIIQQYEIDHNSFHGFNIVHGKINSVEYTETICNVIVPPKKKRRHRRDQLFAILALINTYAAGSDLLLHQCMEFLQKNDRIHRPTSFENEMGKFSDLLVTYTSFEKSSEYVRVAHPMIASKCVELFKNHDVNIGEVTHLFLANFCAERASPSLMQTTKTMLITREMRGENTAIKQDRFSKLIHNIQNRKKGNRMCTGLLKKASEIFQDRPTFPQTLARCYYLMVKKEDPIHMKDYIYAEKWAKEAIRRHPNNSFIMDTLGQVYKHHLIHYVATQQPVQSEVLRLGLTAIQAFQEEEAAAEKEEAEENTQEADVNISPTFNYRGKLGYLQVANQLYETLTNINMDWHAVLTCSGEMTLTLATKLKERYRNLTMTLKGEVEKRFEFFEEYLTYSKPDSKRIDPLYIRKYAETCHMRYRGTLPRVLKRKVEDTEEDVITTLTDLCDFLRKHKTDQSPELFHLELLKPAFDQDIGEVVLKMREAFENVYKKYFRSRYLVPLYIKTTVGWQTLNELKLQPWEIENGGSSGPDEREERAGLDHRDIQQRLDNLKRIQGRVDKPNILAFINKKWILVEPHNKDKVLRDGTISFYLGFSIKGPVAFNIKSEKEVTSVQEQPE